jgi:hypothetical protein
MRLLAALSLLILAGCATSRAPRSEPPVPNSRATIVYRTDSQFPHAGLNTPFVWRPQEVEIKPQASESIEDYVVAHELLHVAGERENPSRLCIGWPGARPLIKPCHVEIAALRRTTRTYHLRVLSPALLDNVQRMVRMWNDAARRRLFVIEE